MTVNVTAVDDAPVNSAPAAQVSAYNAPLVFSTVNGNRISVADADAGGASIQLALNATNGILTLSGSAGLTFASGSNGSASMTFTGSLASIHTLWPLSQSEMLVSPGRVAVNFVDAVFAPEPTAAQRNSEQGPIGIDALGRDQLIARLLTGGYPEVVARSSDKRRNAWFEAYLHTIIQRDIRDLAQIDGVLQLPQLLRALAHKATGTLNTADLSRTLGLAQTTLRRYLHLLETVFLLTPLPAWTPRESHRAQKSPKLFFNDSGLLAHLLGLSTRHLAAAPGLPGALLETFVHGELQKLRGWADTHCELMHYRTASGMEVDFILQDRQGRVVGVEVKSATQARADDFRGLRHLREVLGAQFYRGIVLHPGTQSVAFDPQLASLPVAALWESAASGPVPAPPS